MSDATGTTDLPTFNEILAEPDRDKAMRMLEVRRESRSAVEHRRAKSPGAGATGDGRAALSPMADAVLDLVRRLPGTSWVELCRYIEGARGNRGVFAGRNVLLWNGVSQDLIDAVTALNDAGLIEVRASVPLVYMVDGEIPTLPWARRVPVGGYASPRWLPTVLDLPKRGRR